MNPEIKNRFSGKIIVEAGKYASIKEAVEKNGADLSDANLRGADLSDANLRGADLRDANLRGANLRDADLRDANLRGANLRGANLRGANLRGANLRGANLRGADLILIQADGYTAYIQAANTRIGCEYHPNADWRKWTPEDVMDMALDAKDWWDRYKGLIVAAMDSLPKPADEKEGK